MLLRTIFYNCSGLLLLPFAIRFLPEPRLGFLDRRFQDRSFLMFLLQELSLQMIVMLYLLLRVFLYHRQLRYMLRQIISEMMVSNLCILLHPWSVEKYSSWPISLARWCSGKNSLRAYQVSVNGGLLSVIKAGAPPIGSTLTMVALSFPQSWASLQFFCKPAWTFCLPTLALFVSLVASSIES